MRPTDYSKIKTEYITGDLSVAKLAEKYHVGLKGCTECCRLEGWVNLRKEYRQKVTNEAVQKASRVRAEELAAYSLRMDATAEKLKSVIDNMLAQLEQGRYDLIDGNGSPGREIESISKAINTIDDLKRKLYRELSPRDEVRLQLDREKLELEKQKYNEEKQENRENREVIVRFEGTEGMEE